MTKARELPEGAHGEIRIVWVDPRWRDYPYVRETTFSTKRRTRAPGKKMGIGRLVGYAELAPGTRTYSRRIWILHKADFEPRPKGERNAYTNEAGLIRDCPIEGVLPESVQPGKRSDPAFDELRAHPRSIPPPAPKSKTYEQVIGAMRTVMADLPQLPEKPSRSYPLSYLIEGQPFQMRTARMDTALRAANRAQVECHSAKRERARGGRGPSVEDVSRARIDAAARAYAKWWPPELAQQIAVADFGPNDTHAAQEHREKREAWLARKLPSVR